MVGICDQAGHEIKQKVGHVNLGTSPDTSEFACDSLRWWRESQGHAAHQSQLKPEPLCFLSSPLMGEDTGEGDPIAD